MLVAPLTELHSPITVNEEGLERSVRDQRDRGSGRASGRRTYVAVGDLDGDGTAEIELTEGKHAAPTTRGTSSNRGYVVGQGGTARAADDFLYVGEKKYRR